MKSNAVLILSLVLAACATPEQTAATASNGSTFECERTVPTGSVIPAKRCTNEAARAQEQQDKDDFLNQRRGLHTPAPGNAR